MILSLYNKTDKLVISKVQKKLFVTLFDRQHLKSAPGTSIYDLNTWIQSWISSSYMVDMVLNLDVHVTPVMETVANKVKNVRWHHSAIGQA